jgi:hypothetical protein
MYEKEALPIISRYAKLIGCWSTESGVLNSVVFIWAYDDFAQRAARRADLSRDAEWQLFVPKMLPCIVHQESVFLTPASFSPLK